MANLSTLPALVFLALCVGFSNIAAIVQNKDAAPLDSTKTNLNTDLAATKPEVASFTMMGRMLKSLKEKNKAAPNELSEFSPLLAKIILGLSDKSEHEKDGYLKLQPTAEYGGTTSSMTSIHRDNGHSKLASGSKKHYKVEGKLTAQSSIAEIMAHLASDPPKGTSPLSSAASTSGFTSHTTSVSAADTAYPSNGMKSIGIQLKVALDLLKTSATTLTAAGDIINKVVTETSAHEHIKETATSGIVTYKTGHDPSGTTHGDISVGEKNGDSTYGKNHKEDPNGDWSPSASRKEGSIVDNRHLSPWQGGFGEVVPIEGGSIASPVRQGHPGEKDIVKSGKNSLQPNTKNKDKFKHPLDFPYQAEPYPHLTGPNGKSPNMMPPHPPMDMHSFPGSMMQQFESPVPPQHSMPMGMPNQGFSSGPNQQQFGSGPNPTLNRGFLPPGTPPGFLRG